MHVLGRVAVTVTALLVLAPAAAAASTDLDPATLPRGADLDRPYVVGDTLVDGDLRVTLDLASPRPGRADGQGVRRGRPQSRHRVPRRS